MRYYKIKITNPKTGQIIRPAYFENSLIASNPAVEGSGADASYTSYIDGINIPNALNVEIDIPVAPYAIPQPNSWLRIWGVGLSELSQATDLQDCNISIYAGMKKGLPLAKPEQSRLPIVEGKIFQPFGNWIGTAMTLELGIQPATGTVAQPINIVLDWRSGKQLGPAIKQALRTAFPRLNPPEVHISDRLVAPNDQIAPYATLTALAQYVQAFSKDRLYAGIRPMAGGEYPGVKITIRGKTILVYDGTKDFGIATFSSPIEIAFEDLIGQPTWLAPNVINFKTVMRSDLGVSDYIKMPASLITPFVQTTPAAAYSNVPSRKSSTFKGKFWIQSVHQFGNFRQADAASWVTSFNAVSPEATTGPFGEPNAPRPD